MIDESKLLPCPFCGMRGALYESSFVEVDIEQGASEWVGCSNEACAANGPFRLVAALLQEARVEIITLNGCLDDARSVIQKAVDCAQHLAPFVLAYRKDADDVC